MAREEIWTDVDPATEAIALCSVVPSADVTIYTTSLLAKYSLNENISVFGGLSRFALGDSEPLQQSLAITK